MMSHLLFARQAAISMCVIGIILPAVACSQTELKVNVSREMSQAAIRLPTPRETTSRNADSDRAAVQDRTPSVSDRIALFQPPPGIVAGSSGPAAAPKSLPTPAALKMKVDVEPEVIPVLLTSPPILEKADSQLLTPLTPPVTADPTKADNQLLMPLTPPVTAGSTKADNQLLVPLASPDKVVPASPADASRLIGPFEILDQVQDLSVIMRRSTLMRSKVDISRSAVVDPSICDVIQFSPREVSIIGKSQGATNVTFWFHDPALLPRTFLVKVTPDPEVKKLKEQRFGMFEQIIAQLFPNSKVKLIPVGDKLMVTGQARDAAEAAQIMALIRGEATDQQGRWSYGHLVQGTTMGPLTADEVGHVFPASQVINLLKIPGVQQVVLRVKIAELNRTAGRSFGVDLDMNFPVNSGSMLLQSLLNAGSGKSIVGTFDHDKLNFGIHYLEEHGVMRMLSEPTLVTLSGRPASFVAGGEFAVPTVVGVQGASAVTTDFRAFGAIITFLPVVLDKDHIRLDVSPEFSKVNKSLSSGGVPGLDTRSVTTTVEMRKGQTLAIAGLLDDSMKNDTAGDVPFLAQIFGQRNTSRAETELIILVTPELVHPMDPEEVPPLPGFDVTEPNNTDFYLQGHIEGRPTESYRSTVWPRLRYRYNAGGSAMISGPYGHGD